MRRLDKAGRDVTQSPGLHDEADLCELTVGIPASDYEYLAEHYPQAVEVVASLLLASAIDLHREGSEIPGRKDELEMAVNLLWKRFGKGRGEL